jgi:hypothetical protein
MSFWEYTKRAKEIERLREENTSLRETNILFAAKLSQIENAILRYIMSRDLADLAKLSELLK